MRVLVFLLCLAISSYSSVTNTVSTTDSALYVSGKVTNTKGDAISDASVNLGELETTTNERGCFKFKGSYPEHPINVKISKAGYRSTGGEKPYSGYFIGVVLTEINSPDADQITWTELDISNPNLNVKC